MAQMERTQRNMGSSGSGSGSGSGTPRNTITTMEQFLHYDDPHFREEDHSQHSRKSVITKMKEKTKRWRETLVKKKPDDNVTPTWGVSLDEEDDYDQDVEPEYLGAPMYESELAPEDCREAARQHPRANPVISNKHFLATNFTTQHHEEHVKDQKGKQIDLAADDKTITQTMADKLSPACAAVTATLAPNQADSPILSPNASNTRTGNVTNMPTGTGTGTGTDTPPSAGNTGIGNVVNMGTGVGVVAGISPSAANARTGSIASMDTGISPRAASIRTDSVASMDTGTRISPRAANTRTGSVASMGPGTSTGISPSAAYTRSGSVACMDTGTGISPRAANTRTGSVASMGTGTGTGISPRAANTRTGSIASMGMGIGSGAGAGYHQQQWDKGVSVKEYVTHKLEPGEDEIALSQVITEAISPRKPTASGGDKHEEGMVEKVKDAVSSLLWTSNDSSPSSSTSKATKTTTIKSKPANNASTNVPVSTNAYSVQEEEEQINKGRILQTN
ncbi:apomucin-like isoform X2 [Macadamia integrifolia]|uniref:apomucin-like isoform X2 n=1 Tax=Macadamia integrifolia TaxID=60698 RepID=UPI001C4EF336|nr:apomucin-like isoform X2 [Macadamia integrifolia]